MSDFTHDVIVIGAGPAGLSAAMTAKAQGLRTLLLDEQVGPGGQIYRNISAIPPAVAELLGKDYRHGEGLAARVERASIDIKYGALVWDVARDLTLTVQQSGKSFQVRAPQLIAATGALERPSPIPGWTLPGVLTAGAAQIALKSGSSVPAGRVVLAGAGPLLLLVACQLLDAGVDVRAIVQTSPHGNLVRALRHLPAAMGAPAYLVKGLRMLMKLRKAGVPVHSAAHDLRVEGQQQAEALVFRAEGREWQYEAETVLLHHGVVPNTQLSRLMRVEHDWDVEQLAWRPRLDAWGQTSLAGLRIAGDGAAIGGALAAEPAGELAAIGAALALGKLDVRNAEAQAAPLRAQLARQLRIRPFLDALYRPPKWLTEPSDDTVVCRCEEVTAGQIREMARLGCQGPNQTKFFSRCGMGPCQGRMCGLTVTQLLASSAGTTPEEVGAYHIRSPLKPVPLGSLAMLAQPGPVEPPH
ncbi:NAD(P)/FAD-dependent oxidoreductase [Pseudomonas sp. PD9R]|uniref:NAD(P)/FAD-dependent oxidoreductase n=1 Tax=Pseudomonas sp. PD9R TaxID=2853534 RepID=UPI001C46613E|nr:NAD(P)/FAD-dependent oxidoreductase [Pseudomonas sp. PD9R]MBV6827349.1 FAD-dependent oxidoreductase [Pseudomonas sp. PD9R]